MKDILSAIDAEKLIDHHCLQLREHFDSVRIFVTRHDEKTSNTLAMSRGRGNYYSATGYVREWMERQDEGTREEERAFFRDEEE